MRVDDVSDDDLHAFVDDQLDVARRVEVERYLLAHPDHARRVQADLLLRDSLRAAMTMSEVKEDPRTTALANRLQDGLTAPDRRSVWRRLAWAALVFGIGWITHIGYADWRSMPSASAQVPPAFINDALMAYQTSVVRANMASQPEVPYFDADEILRLVGIPMPSLPDDWVVRDVQVYPSSSGPSVVMVLDADSLGSLSLFAARAHGARQIPDLIKSRKNGAAIAYWQEDTTAYAITGQLSDADLTRIASRLTSGRLPD